MFTVESRKLHDRVTVNYQRLSTNEKLVLFWFVYGKVKGLLSHEQLKTDKSLVAQEIFRQLEKLSFDEQLEIERGILEGKDSLTASVYSSFCRNTKLFFWYLIAQGMERGTIAPIPEDCAISVSVIDILYQIDLMGFEQQITFLKDAFDVSL